MYHKQGGRGVAGSQVPELLEQLKNEFEQITQVALEANICQIQRDDYEKKLEAQLSELKTLQQNLLDLERKHALIAKGQDDGSRRPRLDPGVPDPKRSRTDESNQFPRLGPAPSHLGGPGDPPSVSALSGGGKAPLNQPALQLPSFCSSDAGGTPSVPSLVSKSVQDENAPDWNLYHNPNVQTQINVQLSHTLEHRSVVCCVNFSADGKHMVTGCHEAAVLYYAKTGEKLRYFTSDGVFEPSQFTAKAGDSYFRSVCFSPDCQYLVAGSEDKAIKVWDIEGKRLRYNLLGHELDIYSVHYCTGGRWVVSGSGDKKAKLWDMQNGECRRTFGGDATIPNKTGPAEGVTSVAMTPDGSLIAAGSLDHIVWLWDTETGTLLDKIEAHTDSVYSVVFAPDGKSLASGSLDKTVKLWDVSGGRSQRSRLRNTFTGHKDFVLSVTFSPRGNFLLSGSKDRSLRFWDPRLQDGEPLCLLQGHHNSVISLAHAPDTDVFATGSGDMRARVWNYSADGVSPK
eukprot:CAMPEP_0114556758 /NCGR_PEP_ID=MMETSP0114-20121206/9458_1 /TAXON_ID=31324 /ORGANISM="Goniomonas sp, Strain m" /LENGTH=512 /DNA_ID=CAMNT_0001741981 /DNA_START=19 /DNA_END=1557 /DNA_ORIENTATION=-